MLTTTGSFLVLVVSKDGVLVDPAKVEVVTKWVCAIIVTKVYSFLGLVGYYQQFIRDFAKITHHSCS